MGNINNKPDIDTLLSWTYEALIQHSVWQADSWQDVEFRDGLHWETETKQKLIAKGINPLTINRVFPILNLIIGNYINNQRDIIAKGRTKKDTELAQVASEAIAYINDQNNGTSLQREAFEFAITAGLGCIYTGYNSDPRQEQIALRPVPWYTLWWDPYASPWFNVNTCRYVFTADWKDKDDVKMYFPNKAKEIENACDEITNAKDSTLLSVSSVSDIGMNIELYKSYLSAGQWVNSVRKRIRPVEMWYTVIEPTWFAIMPDNQAFELDKYPVNEQYQIVQYSKELQKAYVKQMYVSTFLGKLELQTMKSPYPFIEYPFTSFIGYLDRYQFPFGIPRQIKEQNLEVNKRRSMALALIGGRRTIIEKGAAEDLTVAQREANRFDGFIVVEKGKMQSIDIKEMAELAVPQIDMMRQSELEMKEIVGANDESLGYNTPPQSGISLEKKKQFSSTMTLSLMENTYRSQKALGEKILALIQKTWTEPKVFRVVDRLSGVEKFVEINRRILDEQTGAITVQNDISSAKFDLIISTKEITDTMREKNLDLLFSAINKAPPEAVAPLLNVAFEISDIPEKERILDKIRMATGMNDMADDDLTTEQRKEKLRAAQADMQAKQQEQYDTARMAAEVERRKGEAEINKLMAEAQAEVIKAQAQKQIADQDGFVKGQELANKMLEAEQPKPGTKKEGGEKK